MFRRRVALAVVGALAGAALTVVLEATPAAAVNVFTVTTTIDGGPGSLRAAFAEASADNDASEIVLQAGATYLLTAYSALTYTENEALTLTGNGAKTFGTCGGRIIDSTGTGALTVNALRIESGFPAGDGAGIRSAGPLVVTGSTILGNGSYSAGNGAGIYGFDDIEVTGSRCSPT